MSSLKRPETSKSSPRQEGFTTPEALVWIVATLLILSAVGTGSWAVVRGGDRVFTAATWGAELLRTEQLLRREASNVELPYWSREEYQLSSGVLIFYDRRSDETLLIDRTAEQERLRAGDSHFPLPGNSHEMAIGHNGGWARLTVTVAVEGHEPVVIEAPLGGRGNALW